MGFEHLIEGFRVAFTATNLLGCFLGVLVGTMVGVLPGLGPMAAMTIMLSFTAPLGATTALITLAGVWYGAQYGGSTTSILVNIPGENSSVITCIDGYAMARKGRAGSALAVSAVGSFFAGTVGILIMQLAAPPIGQAALKFGPPEYLSVMIFALVALSTLVGDNPLKGSFMVAIGILFSTVGVDRMFGVKRFTFGIPAFMYGIDIVPICVGLFGIGEILQTALNPYTPPPMRSVHFRDLYPNRDESRRSLGPIARGTILGFFLGLLPGTPAVLASFTSYSLEKDISPRRREFGQGAIEGVAGPESANNSAVIGGLIPLLCLGLPFSPSATLLLAGLEMNDIVPGPTLITDKPEIFWGFIAMMYVGNFMLLILNLPLVGIFARLAILRPAILLPFVVIICLLGVYAVRLSMFDVYVMLFFGVLGLLLRRASFPLAPLVVGMVLGSQLEDNLRLTLKMFQGDLFAIFLRPISAVILVALPLYILAMRRVRKRILISGLGSND